MAHKQSPTDRIQELKAEIASLEQAALAELKERRHALAQELGSVDTEIAHLTGKPIEGRKPYTRRTKRASTSLPLQELKDLLSAAPGKTLNIRKAGLELANIKTLASANPQLLKLGG